MILTYEQFLKWLGFLVFFRFRFAVYVFFRFVPLVVLDLVSSVLAIAKRFAGKNVFEMTDFCRVGRETITSSINYHHVS